MTVTIPSMHFSPWPALQLTIILKYRNTSIWRCTLAAICGYGKTQYQCGSTLHTLHHKSRLRIYVRKWSWFWHPSNSVGVVSNFYQWTKLLIYYFLTIVWQYRPSDGEKECPIWQDGWKCVLHPEFECRHTSNYLNVIGDTNCKRSFIPNPLIFLPHGCHQYVPNTHTHTHTHTRHDARHTSR